MVLLPADAAAIAETHRCRPGPGPTLPCRCTAASRAWAYGRRERRRQTEWDWGRGVARASTSLVLPDHGIRSNRTWRKAACRFRRSRRPRQEISKLAQHSGLAHVRKEKSASP